jgi:hypothetical protein
VIAKGWVLTFKRWLDERNQSHLRWLRDILFSCPLSTEKDSPKWIWEETWEQKKEQHYQED